MRAPREPFYWTLAFNLTVNHQPIRTTHATLNKHLFQVKSNADLGFESTFRLVFRGGACCFDEKGIFEHALSGFWVEELILNQMIYELLITSYHHIMRREM